MASEHYQRAKDIFYQACEMGVLERSAFVERECNGDSALRDEIDRLLQVDDDSGFLQQPALGEGDLLHRAVAGMSNDRGPALMPVSIGSYRIIRLIGEGGMGSVYEAEQDSPRRTVALKVIRAALPSKRMVQRFEREIEILGRLHHPNIAQIHEAGLAETPAIGERTLRLPYYAMEFIDGLSLIEHAAQRELSDRERLVLLATVCEAVHFGHVNGVVHRDLKPGNILVDGMGRPKIIDFGVARATNMDHPIATINTHSGMLIGTLAYMSPEQVCGVDGEANNGSDNATIDGRCDVYALGVIGFELLGGRLPYELAGRSVPEAARIIRDEDPSSLSSISRTHRGDVETIIRRAMAKEPARRYSTAAEMAADIRRFLNDEPIQARPPTLRYQLTKFARRHKELVAGLALVFLVLLGGIIGTSLAMMQAQQNARDATIQAKRALSASTFIQEVLASASPTFQGGGRDVRIADVLDDAVKQLDQSTDIEPEVELQARRTIGESYLGLSLHDDALINLMRAFELANQLAGPQSRDTMLIANVLAWVLLDLDRYADAKAVVEPATATALNVFGAVDRCSQELLYTAACTAIAASDCQLQHQHLTTLYDAIKPLAASDREIELRTVLFAMAWGAQQRGDWAEAESRIRLALAEPPVEASRAGLRTRRGTSPGTILVNQQMWPEAERAWRDLVQANERRYGLAHAETHDALSGLRQLFDRRGDLAGALVMRRQDLEVTSRAFPDGHLATAMIWGNIGILLARMGETVEAGSAFAEAVAMSRKTKGDEYFISHSWWREAVIRLGMGLHDPWASEALRWHTLRAVDNALTANPTDTFEFDEIDWSTLQVAVEPFPANEPRPSQEPPRLDFVSGDLVHLKAQPDPPPGIYRLDLRVERRGAEPIQSSVWMLVAPWTVRAFKAWPCTIFNPDLWRKLVENSPAEERLTAGLCYSNWWEAGFGPNYHEEWFGMTATAVINVPEGKYNLLVHADDGARVWLDEQLVIDDWIDRAWTMPMDRSVPVDLPHGPIEIRIEYFQTLGEARLWVRLEPVFADATRGK